MEMLRDRSRASERQIVEMIRNGQENVSIADKLHRWTRALMLTANAADLPDVLVAELQHQFLIPQAAIRVWGGAEVFAICRSRAHRRRRRALREQPVPCRTAASTPASRRCSGSSRRRSRSAA